MLPEYYAAFHFAVQKHGARVRTEQSRDAGTQSQRVCVEVYLAVNTLGVKLMLYVRLLRYCMDYLSMYSSCDRYIHLHMTLNRAKSI